MPTPLPFDSDSDRKVKVKGREEFPIRQSQKRQDERAIRKATKKGVAACWVGLSSSFVGGALSVVGLIIGRGPTESTTKFDTWFGLTLGIWIVIAMVQGVLFWEVSDKLGRHSQKLVSRCRVAYLAVAGGCFVILTILTAVWTFAGSFSDPKDGNAFAILLVFLEFFILILGIVSSLFQYNRYARMIQGTSSHTAAPPVDNPAKKIARTASGLGRKAGDLGRGAGGSIKKKLSNKGRARQRQGATDELQRQNSTYSVHSDDRLPASDLEWDAQLRTVVPSRASSPEAFDDPQSSAGESTQRRPLEDRRTRPTMLSGEIRRKPLPNSLFDYHDFSSSSSDEPGSDSHEPFLNGSSSLPSPLRPETPTNPARPVSSRTFPPSRSSSVSSSSSIGRDELFLDIPPRPSSIDPSGQRPSDRGALPSQRARSSSTTSSAPQPAYQPYRPSSSYVSSSMPSYPPYRPSPEPPTEAYKAYQPPAARSLSNSETPVYRAYQPPPSSARPSSVQSRPSSTLSTASTLVPKRTPSTPNSAKSIPSSRRPKARQDELHFDPVADDSDVESIVRKDLGRLSAHSSPLYVTNPS